MKQKRNIKKNSLFILLSCILAIVLVFIYIHYQKNKIKDEQVITYSGSIQEKNETQAFKDKQIADSEQKQTQSSNQSQKKSVTPVILSTNQVGENINTTAFVQGVVEDEGVCNFVFSQGSKSISKISDGFANATTTNCTPLSFNKSELGAGIWNIVLNYSSANYQGQSQSSTLEVK